MPGPAAGHDGPDACAPAASFIGAENAIGLHLRGIQCVIGLLLPCNVVVRASEAGPEIEALDPQIMVTLTGRPELKPVAGEVARRLADALTSVAS